MYITPEAGHKRYFEIFRKYFHDSHSYTNVYFSDPYNSLCWSPSYLPSLFQALKTLGPVRFVKGIAKNARQYLDKRNYFQLDTGAKPPLFLVPTRAGLLFLENSGKFVYKITKADNPLMKKKQLETLGSALAQTKKTDKKHIYPKHYQFWVDCEEGTVIEKTEYFLDEGIKPKEWPQILDKIAPVLLDFYRNSGVQTKDARDTFHALVSQVQNSSFFPNLEPQIEYFSNVIRDFNATIITAMVHSDLQRFNVLKKGADIRIIDFGGSVRKNIFWDAYIQERWSPTPAFWQNITSDMPIPDNTSHGLVYKIHHNLLRPLGIKLSDEEIKLHLFMAFLEQMARGGNENHPVYKVLTNNSS